MVMNSLLQDLNDLLEAIGQVETKLTAIDKEALSQRMVATELVNLRIVAQRFATRAIVVARDASLICARLEDGGPRENARADHRHYYSPGIPMGVHDRRKQEKRG